MTDEEKTETGRARVRRLLIDPLVADGFRKKPKTDEDVHQAFLDRIADSFGYMTDTALSTLRASLATKGEGSARNQWPSFATINGLAEAFQARPLRELPELLRWFASNAGRTAAAEGEGRLVAEHLFWRRHKRPPLHEPDRRWISEKADELGSRARRIRERQRLELPPTWPDDPDWLKRFDARVAYLKDLVEGASGEAAA